MLSIIMKSGKEYKWHVGENLPIPHEKIMEVAEIQADGDELTKIVITCPIIISILTSPTSINLIGVFAQQAIANL